MSTLPEPMPNSAVPGPRASGEPMAPTTDKQPNFPIFELWGLKIPIPRWAAFVMGALVAIGSGASAYVNWIQPMIAPPVDTRLAQYDEYQKHVAEPPEDKDRPPIFDSEERGMLKVNYYRSDGCLQVMRRNPGPNQPVVAYWILQKSIKPEEAPGKTLTQVLESVPRDDRFLALVHPFSVTPPSASETNTCGGRCVDPHYGQFQAWNGEQNGCWVAVWRRWPEGCQHYQWYNTCGAYWDSLPNGAPRVYWTCCVH